MILVFREFLQSVKLLLWRRAITRITPTALAILALNMPAECAVLDLSVRDIDGGPAVGVVFQIFPGRVGVDDDIMPLLLGDPLSDAKDNDGDGEVDESDEDFPGYATAADGKLRLDLAGGSYALVGFSRDRHFVFVEEVSVPGSIVISAADAVPVSVSCRAADGSPIVAAEIFFRPTKCARASVGYTDNSGSLRAYVSGGEYHVVLWSITGPYYLVLPHQTISRPQAGMPVPPEAEVNFHVAEIPTGEVHFDLPEGTGVAIFEVLESTYTREYAEGVEPEIGYDAAYTDFYPLITTEYPCTLSAGIDYNFNMSLAVIFGMGTIYAYELRPTLHSIKPGVQYTGITENDSFALQIRADRGDENPIYYPGDTVNLSYYFTDDSGDLLYRILNFTGARLIFPTVTVWDPHEVPIADNFGTENFFGFSFDLPLSAALGEYRAEITLDAGIYGKIAGDLRFHVRPDSDSEPPQITSLDLPAEFEAGQDLVVTAAISDNVGLAERPELRVSLDAGASWTGFPMASADGDLYRSVVPSDLLALGEFNWQIAAADLAGNRIQRSGTITIVDTSSPIIDHGLLTKAELGREVRIRADVRDNVGVAEVTLFYIIGGTGEDGRPVKMSETEGIYSASIPGSQITFDGVGYYIRATDTVGNVAFLPAGIGVPEFAYVDVKDTTAPAISHIPVNVGIANAPVRIEAIITDNSGVVDATLFYKSTRDQDYRSISMDNRGEVYLAQIPAEAVVQEGVHYHIMASDGADPDGNIRTSVSPADGDYSVEVRSELDNGLLASLEVSPSAAMDAPLDLAAGGSVKFSAVGRGETGELLPADVTWAAIGGIGHIDQDGTFLAAGRIAAPGLPGGGVGRIVATARYIGVYDTILQAETWVRISPGPPAQIMLNPTSITIAAGDTQEFFATVTDMYSNPVPAEINWNVDAEEQIGTISNGIFSGSKAGSGHVVAEVNGLRAVSDVVVMPGLLRTIEIGPPSPVAVAGDTMQFTAKSYDAFGNYISVAPVWSVRDGVGTIRGDGLFRGGIAGSGQVVATVGGISTAVDVEVVPGQLHSISVSPYATYLPVSTEEYPSTQQFVADGRDVAGNPVPLKSISWTTDALAGTISASGLFRAVTDPGVRLGEIVTNGTIWAHGTSTAGGQATGKGYIVVQKSPASHLSSISAFVQGTSGELEGVSLATGESAQFEAAGSDVKGRSLAIDPSWSVEGGIGDIDVSGLLTATRPGSGAVVATAGGFTGRIQVEVTPGVLKSIAVKPDMLVLIPGAQRSLMAVGYDSFENVVPIHNIHWSVEGDAVTIEPDGASCIVTVAGSGNNVVSARAGDLVGSANIFAPSASISLAEDILRTVSEGDHRAGTEACPYYLEIEPQLINIPVGAQQQFAARAVDVLGDESDSGSLSWSVAGDIGEIDGSGRFRAGDKPGSGRVIVTDGRVFGTAVVIVSASAAVGTRHAVSLLIIPSDVSLAAGVVEKFAAFTEVDGELIPILPAWRAIGDIGTIDAAGRFMATTVGEGQVEATAGGLSVKCHVTVLAGSPAQIEIQPSSLSIRVGEKQKFSVRLTDKMGNLVASSPVFQIAGELGVIDDNGLFTAQKVGAGSVIAVASRAGTEALPLLAEARVEVLHGSLAEIEVLPAEQKVAAGSSVKFSAVGKDAYGNVIPVDPTWDVLGSANMGSISSEGLFVADKVGQGQVRATAGGIIGAASIEVHPAAPAFILVEPALISVSSQVAEAEQFTAAFVDLRGNNVGTYGSADVELSWAVTEGIGSIDPQTGLFVNETDLHEPRTGYVTATAVINRGKKLERTIRGRAAVILYPVAKPLATISITPDAALVIRGDTQRFAAVGKDADGIEMQVHPAWSVVSDDGSLEIPNVISADGVFSATPEMEVGSSWRVLASALNSEGQTIQGEARLSLTTGPLQSIEIVCKGDAVDRVSLPDMTGRDACPTIVESGQIIEVEAVGYDQFRNEVQISPDWRVAGGIGTLEIGTGGQWDKGTRGQAVLTAGRAGSGEVIAEAEGKEGRTHITVVPGPLVDIKISTDPPPTDESVGASEANPLILAAGSELRFVVVGQDSDVDVLGRPKPVNFINVSPTWSVRGSDETVNLGSISSDGRFTAKEVGTGRIEAVVPTHESPITGFFHIQVVAGDLASIRVSPSFVSVVSGEGNEQQFSASGYDLYGNQIAHLQPIWQVTGNIGDIDESGLLRPALLPPGSSAISGTVVAAYGGVQGSASVSVVPALGKLSALSVAVEPSVIQAGRSAICVIKGTDEMGNLIADPASASAELSVSVPAGLGTVIPSDQPNEWTFRADRNLSPDPNQRTGRLMVTAKIDGRTLSADASLTLIPGPLDKISVEPAAISLSAGSKAVFKALAYDSWGNQRDLPFPEWTVSPDLGNIVWDTATSPQEAVFSAVTAGQGQLIVSSQGYEGRADLVVLPGELETLTVEPKAATIAAGSSHRFAGIGEDRYGNEIEDLKLHWQILSDVSIGSVTEDGLFSAVKTGDGKLRAVYRGAAAVVSSDEASITVIPGSIASATMAIHKEGEILEPPFVLLSGSQYDVRVRGTDLWGNQISHLEEVAWNMAGDIGSIKPSPEDASNAVLTTLFPDGGQITVSIGKISAHAEVEVVPHSQNVSSREGARIIGPFGASINIPPGALRSDEKISIALSPSPGPAERAERTGYVYSFEPDGTVFAVPAELTLSYSGSESDGERLSLYSWDRFQKTWIRVGGVTDPYQKSVTATVNYLSLFAIMQEEPELLSTQSDDLSISRIRLSPNTYFAPEINRLTIHYNIGCAPRQPAAVTIEIYDIRGHLVKALLDRSPKYAGGNTDQWDGTDDVGEIVRNGRYILLITAETDSDKVSKTAHLAVFK